MNNRFDATVAAVDSCNDAADDMCSSFANRIGRELTQSERSFVEQLFADGGIAVRSWIWDECFDELVITSEDVVGDAGRFRRRWGKAFGAGYQELFGPAEAMSDIVAIEDLSEDQALGVRAYRIPADCSSRFRFKLYHRHQAVPLTDVLAVLEPMGLKALVEEGFPVRPFGGDEIWVHEFLVDDPRGEDLVFSDIAREFESAFAAVWSGRTENDGFNRLVLEAGATWRETAAIRTLAQYRQQTGMDASQRTQIRAVIEHADLTRLLIELFKVKFDPHTGESVAEREVSAEYISRLIEQQLQQVPSVESDRVLRNLYHLICATKRTNFFQAGENGDPKSAISLKIASREIAALPEPKPYREIFVSSPTIEGVHLRFGPVSRGGLRWSDRRDDFRTEVLGLVKAQQVKNAVIVPVGAKGGFVVKGPRLLDPAASRESGVDAYRQFLSAMLDVTDNIDADGTIVSPPLVVRHDEADPYLVVAADKGTASFSDIANEISSARGFWLGDAFASGGSDGYDHKAMGITARGAWEAVKRHFRESGKDIEEEEFTVVGVGDMSGDVFGNGMLLSDKTLLIAAFDHRDIFIDPDPDAASSWMERKRLFDLPRSSWQDYDRGKLSKGGAIFSRTSKEVELSDEARAALDIEQSVLSPTALIQAILRAPVELLYMGGIGTLVKSSNETDQDASDKANDAVRVDASELRARIVGEGANLGFTQAGRIEFARRGGRINTDAIDNSAGVESSDLEVNIKILTSVLEQRGQLSRDQRNELLTAMTDEVASQVLSHNRSQTLALSLAEAEAANEIAAHGEFIEQLEKTGKLNRALENLPLPGELQQLKVEGKGLTRPELAVLLAYAKLTFFDELVSSSAPDDPHLERLLEGYFPRPLSEYRPAMREHRLRREIVATALANRIVDVAGPTFPTRLEAASGRGAGELAKAFVAAGEIFGLDRLWTEIGCSNDRISAELQNRLYSELARAWRRQTYGLSLRLASTDDGVSDLIGRYAESIGDMIDRSEKLITNQDQQGVSERTRAMLDAGVPKELTTHILALDHLGDALVIADLARSEERSILDVGQLHEEVARRFGFKELIDAAASIDRCDRFDWIALRRLVEDLRNGQEQLTRAILLSLPAVSAVEAVQSWVRTNEGTVSIALDVVAQARSTSGPWTLGRLTVAAKALSAI